MRDVFRNGKRDIYAVEIYDLITNFANQSVNASLFAKTLMLVV